MQEIIEKCGYSFTITSVRKMRVRIESFMSLSFVDKFFDGVEDLEIMYSNGDEWTVNRMTHDEKTMIVNVLCGMSKLQNARVNALQALTAHLSNDLLTRILSLQLIEGRKWSTAIRELRRRLIA